MTNEATEPQTHVFRKPCGCVSTLIVNVPSMFKELAKAQTYAAKHGGTYELIDTQKVREMDWKCPQHKKANPTFKAVIPIQKER